MYNEFRKSKITKRVRREVALENMDILPISGGIEYQRIILIDSCFKFSERLNFFLLSSLR